MARTETDVQHDDPTSEQRPRGVLGWLTSCIANESTPRDIENMRRWLVWLFAWAVLSLPDADWVGLVEDETSWFTVGQALLVLATFVGALAAYVRYLRQTDELNRRIQTTALSIGFGAGWFANQLGEALANAGFVESVDVDVPVLAMLITYSLASVRITASYR